MIESRAGKFALVATLLILSAILATSRPKKPRVIYPLAVICGLMAVGLAWRVKPAPPMEQSFPLGEPMAFIAAVPSHLEHLALWARSRGLSPPPVAMAELEEWLWSNREVLAEEWGRLMHGLVATYGQALRAMNPSLVWSVRRGEPVLASPGSLLPGRRVFNDVHDAVFADV